MAAFMLAVLSVIARLHVQRESELVSLPSQSISNLSAKPSNTATTRLPYPMHLAQAASPDAIVRDSFLLAPSNSVAIISVEVASREPTAMSLGRATLDIVLRGGYANLKSTLAQLLDRYPNAVLERVSFRSLSYATELEASIGLVLVTRPVSVTPGN